MSVKFMEKNPPGFLTALGVNLILHEGINKGLCSFYIGANTFKITGLGKLSHYSVSGNLSETAITLLKTAGKSGTNPNFIGKSFSRFKVETAFVEFYKKTNIPVDYIPKSEDEEKQKEKEAQPAVQTKSPESVVLLRNASVQYQRVKGTTAGKVYVAVGISPDINLAVRLKGNALSARVESASDKLQVYADKLKNLGFGVTPSYASLHLTCDSNATPEKVVGAILLGLGVPFQTGLPNVDTVRKISE